MPDPSSSVRVPDQLPALDLGTFGLIQTPMSDVPISVRIIGREKPTLQQNCCESTRYLRAAHKAAANPSILLQRGGENPMVQRFSNPSLHFTAAPNRPFVRLSTFKICPNGFTPKQAPGAPPGDKKLTILDNPLALSSRQARLCNLTGPWTS